MHTYSLFLRRPISVALVASLLAPSGPMAFGAPYPVNPSPQINTQALAEIPVSIRTAYSKTRSIWAWLRIEWKRPVVPMVYYDDPLTVFKVGDLVRELESQSKGLPVEFHVDINEDYQLKANFRDLSKKLMKDIKRSMRAVKARAPESPLVEVVWEIRKSKARIKVREGISGGIDYSTNVPILPGSLRLLGERYPVQTLSIVVSGIAMLLIWITDQGNPLSWAVSWIGWAGLVGWALFSAIPPRKPGIRPYTFREKVLVGLLGIHFVLGGFAVFHFTNTLIAIKPWFEGVSDMVLGFDGAVIGGIIAQWYKTRSPKHKQRKFKWQDMMELIILSVALALLMDGYIYGHLLPILAARMGIVPAVILDLLLISLFFADPSAMFFYSRILQNKPRRSSFDEIRSGDLLSFYLQTWWIWGLTMLVALGLAPISQVASFGVAVSGLLIWNLFFEAETAPSLEERFEGWRKNAPFKFKYFVPPLRAIRWVHASPGFALFLVTSFFSVILGATSYYLELLHWGAPWNWIALSFVSSLAVWGIWGGDIRERLEPLIKRGLPVGAAMALAAVGLGILAAYGKLPPIMLSSVVVIPFLGRFDETFDTQTVLGFTRQDHIDVKAILGPYKTWEEVEEALLFQTSNKPRATNILHLLQNASRQKIREAPVLEVIPAEAPIQAANSIEAPIQTAIPLEIPIVPSVPAAEIQKDNSIRNPATSPRAPAARKLGARLIWEEYLIFLQDILPHMTEDEAITQLAGRSRYLGPDKIREFRGDRYRLNVRELSSLRKGMNFLRRTVLGETNREQRIRNAKVLLAAA